MTFNASNIPNSSFTLLDYILKSGASFVDDKILGIPLAPDKSYRLLSSPNRTVGDSVFIIGFVPPDIKINYVPVLSKKGEFIRGKKATVVYGGGGGTKRGVGKSAYQNVKDQPDWFWEEFVIMCKDLGMKPEDLLTVWFKESNFGSDSINFGKSGNPAAKGLFQYNRAADSKSFIMSQSEWDNFENLSAYEQLKYAKKFYTEALRIAKSSNPNASYSAAGGILPIYLATIAPSKTKAWTDENEVIYTKSGNPEAYSGNSGLDVYKNDDITGADLTLAVFRATMTNDQAYVLGREKISEAETRIAKNERTPVGKNPTSAPAVASITSTGSSISIVITDYTTPDSETPGLYAGPIIDPEQDALDYNNGRNLEQASLERPRAELAVKEINKRLEELKATPSLMMLINPKNFNRRYEHSVDYASGRSGPIVSMWLEQPMKISGSGTSSAFFAVDNENRGGITHNNRTYTLSYENVLSLSLMYRNNGWLKSDYGVGGDKYNVLATSIYIYFDGHVYLGSFDSFKISESADKPYSIEYDFEFTVRYEMRLNDTGEGTDIDAAAFQNAVFQTGVMRNTTMTQAATEAANLAGILGDTSTPEERQRVRERLILELGLPR